MKRGDVVAVRVERIGRKGDGLGTCGEREVRVRGGIPGDLLEVKLQRKRKGVFEGALVRVVEEGAARVAACCAHFGRCGGCRWQDVPYPKQLELKFGMVRSALASAGVADIKDLRPVVGCSEVFRYRNKMEFSFGQDGCGKVELGLHARGRFDSVLDIGDCWLQSALCSRVVGTVREQASQLGLSVYDLRRHLGLLRFLVLRQSGLNGDLLVNLVVSEFPHEGVRELVSAVLAAVPEITTWIISVHQGKAQVAQGQEEFVVHGAGSIVDACNGVVYRISPRSFFQTNSSQVGLLYRLIRQLAGDLRNADVLDLYCGAGGISLQLAPGARAVLGVEDVVDAVSDARRNALDNGVSNCSFVAGKVEDLLPELCSRSFELIVVDPPRPGLHKRVLESLLRLRPPRIIYVSCNPETLAADLSSLTADHYGVRCVWPVDMFPHTPHCEVVCELVRGK